MEWLDITEGLRVSQLSPELFLSWFLWCLATISCPHPTLCTQKPHLL